jgi:hypothetical protein
VCSQSSAMHAVLYLLLFRGWPGSRHSSCAATALLLLQDTACLAVWQEAALSVMLHLGMHRSSQASAPGELLIAQVLHSACFLLISMRLLPLLRAGA